MSDFSRFADRRKEPRFRTSGSGRVICPDGEEVVGQIMDVSRSGMCIRIPKMLCPGDRIAVKLTTVTTTGEVRYVIPVLHEQFDIGVLLDEEETTGGRSGLTEGSVGE